MRANLLTSLVDDIESGSAIALVTCIAAEKKTLWMVGQQSLVRLDGGPIWEGDLPLGPEVARQVQTLIRAGQTQRLQVDQEDATGSLFVEVYALPRHLLIVGAGHIAVPLAQLGTICEFSVTVLDDRPQYANKERFPIADAVITADFVPAIRDLRQQGRLNELTYIALVTRGHQHDVDCLTEVLDDDLAYVGMIGSKRRIRAVFELLQAENGLPKSKFEHVRAPIGLNIGAQTPAEIAVCIMAEIINSYRQGPALAFRDEL